MRPPNGKKLKVSCPIKSLSNSVLQLLNAPNFNFKMMHVFYRAVEKGYLTKDMVDYMDPSLMFAIPRLAIVW